MELVLAKSLTISTRIKRHVCLVHLDAITVLMLILACHVTHKNTLCLMNTVNASVIVITISLSNRVR